MNRKGSLSGSKMFYQGGTFRSILASQGANRSSRGDVIENEYLE